MLDQQVALFDRRPASATISFWWRPGGLSLPRRLVANGSTLEKKQEQKQLEAQPFRLLWSQQGLHFHDLAAHAKPLALPRVYRGLAVSDYDGDQDVIVASLDEGVRLLRNDLQRGHWLELRLRNRSGAEGSVLGFGEGASVVVHSGELSLRRSVTFGSYLSQSSRTLHFGLGDAVAVDRVEIRWGDGKEASLGPLAADSIWQVTQGS